MKRVTYRVCRSTTHSCPRCRAKTRVRIKLESVGHGYCVKCAEYLTEHVKYSLGYNFSKIPFKKIRRVLNNLPDGKT